MYTKEHQRVKELFEKFELSVAGEYLYDFENLLDKAEDAYYEAQRGLKSASQQKTGDDVADRKFKGLSDMVDKMEKPLEELFKMLERASKFIKDNGL